MSIHAHRHLPLRATAAGLAATVILAACSGEPSPGESPDPGPTDEEPQPTQEEPEATEDPPEETGDSAPEEDAPEDEPEAYGYGVSAAHPAAVEAGMTILEDGGTAGDAAIATAFAVAVVEPFASGIGGGGSAVVAEVDGGARAYDYREVVANDGQIPATGTGIPGFVAGMAELHEDHGELPWEELLAPAIDLAADGFPVSDFLAVRLASDRGPQATGALQHFAPGGAPLSAGETLVQSDLAETMRTLAAEGPESFYSGSLASDISTVAGIDAGSLDDYGVQSGEPAAGPFGQYEVLSAAPALPGAAVIQMLQTAEASGAGEVSPGSAEYIQQLSSAWLTARETATTQLGDPDFVDVPVDEITDPQTNAAQISAPTHPEDGDLGELQAAAEEAAVTGSNTTHLSVVDQDGRAVSMSNTVTAFWGSGEYAAGFFLNDQLSRFEAIPSPANSPEPGRRSVSWAAPVIVRDGEARPVLAIGTPGGERIPSILGNVLVRWGLHGEPLAEAVNASRFIQEAESVIAVEPSLPDEARAALSSAGFTVEERAPELAYFGSVQVLEIDHDSGEISAPRDGRREADNEVHGP